MAISWARMAFKDFSGKPRISRSLNFTEPRAWPFFASKPMMAKAVCDLPEPDSPTIPSVSPVCKSKFSRLTAVTSPSSVWKRTSKSLTCSRGMFIDDFSVSDRHFHGQRVSVFYAKKAYWLCLCGCLKCLSERFFRQAFLPRKRWLVYGFAKVLS